MSESLNSEQPQDPNEPNPGTVEVDRGNETDISPPRGHAFPIVGVGGSAGALDAFTKLLQALPEDTGMAFVFVQHLDPHHASQLPEILAKSTAMPVRNVEDGMPVRPNEVFVIPPNATMILEDGVLRLTQRNPGLHLPVDAFFESLASVQGSRAIAIVLSGNASDGTQGAKAIKADCGLTFAQDEGSAQHVGMPRSAVAAGAIDYVMPPVDIARELVRLSQHPFVIPPQPSRPEVEILPEGNGQLKKIYNILRNRTKVDFAHYKVNTIRRRIGRRMIVQRTATLAEYAQLLDRSPDEARELYRDLLISVTSFFRDPEAFDALRQLLSNDMLSRSPNEPFRVWVPGCATGEEVYSLAMLIKEVSDELQLNTPIQLFGTDISDLGLDRARAAVYPELITQDVPPERLRRFFVRADSGYQVSKQIREACVFARQDVTTDPPFGHMDLVSCRNVLIYMDTALQRKVLPVFHYSLNPSGLLLLGGAESIAAASDLFAPADTQHRIYRRKAAPMRLTLNLSSGLSSGNTPDAKVHTTISGIDLQKKADLVIQSKYAPPAVVVDDDLRILHFRGRTGFYLEPTSGEANFHLLRMAREGLSTPLRKALDTASRQAISVREDGIVVEYLGERRTIAIEVTPIPGAARGERYFTVVFLEAGSSAAAQTAEPGPPEPADASTYTRTLEGQVRDLQRQAAEMRELVRNTSEDQEAQTEELRAANEEVRSANEELQSTNEELSTTKEELQSANEELTTLNEELQTRNSELHTANSDLVNLLSAADAAFLIVDNDLRLRRFSGAAETFLNIKGLDVGHPLTHLNGPVDLVRLQPMMRRVVETLSTEQIEMQSKTGRWFTATVRPYRTIDDRIGGAVIVFVDIDALKQNLRAAEKARDYAEGLLETVREPLVVVDGDLRVHRATQAFYDAFGVSRAETEGRFFYDLGNGQWNVPRLRELLGDALYRNQPFHDFELEHTFPHIGRRTVRLNGRFISPEGDQWRSVLLAIEDVTERREQAEIRYQRLFETAQDGMLLFDAETRLLTDVNPYMLELTGFGREQLIGRTLKDMQAFRDAGAASLIGDAVTHEIARLNGVVLHKADGGVLLADLVANCYAVGEHQTVQVNVHDVTDRNRAFEDLRSNEERFRLFVESVRDYALFQLDAEGNISSWNGGAERLLGYTEQEIVGQPVSVIFVPEDVAAGKAQLEIETARTNGSSGDERWHLRKDGSRFFASGVLTSVKDESGRLRGFAKIMRDVTDRNRAEEQLREQAHLLELAQDLIIVRQLDGSILSWNQAAADKYGWSKEEVEGKDINKLLDTKFPMPLPQIEAQFLERGYWEGELVHTRRDGTSFTVWSRWALQFSTLGRPASVLEIDSDISERKRTDAQLRASLHEKEVLLKEIHHRVKNNLQIVSSLLNVQAEHLTDPQAQAMLEEMNTRVRSIAAIHETLYGATDFSQVDFARYLQTLANDVTAVYSNRSGVRVEIDCDAVSLDITQAVPCGLLVNELLTNGFKHAFPKAAVGRILVTFRCPDDECLLAVSDNGAGLAENLEPQSAKSMGFQLMTLLVRQLGGTLRIDRSVGTRFTITFQRKVAQQEQSR